MNEMRIENWQGYEIRFVKVRDEWYAILKDICDALGLRTKDVSQRIDSDCMERVAVPGSRNRPKRYKENYEDGSNDIVNSSNTFWMLAINRTTYDPGFFEIPIPSHWEPATAAQLLERCFASKPSGLVGDISTDYHYFDPAIMKENKPMNKVNHKRKKALSRIENVIFSAPATIVFWSDGSKTVVKAGDHDVYDPEKGLAMAIAKYFFDNEGYYYDVFKKWIPEEQVQITNYESEEQEYVWLTTMEYCKATATAESTVRQKLKEGKIPGAKKVNGKWQIPLPVELL